MSHDINNIQARVKCHAPILEKILVHHSRTRPGPARPDVISEIFRPGPARARGVRGPARPGPTVNTEFSGPSPARPEPGPPGPRARAGPEHSNRYQ